MKSLRMKCLILCLCLLGSTVLAQGTKRIVILPFNTSGGIEVYRLGLAAALQRSLNDLNGVYVPPIGDAILVTQRQLESDTLSIDNVASAFNADIVISGQISVSGDQAEVLLGLAGPSFPTIQNLSFTVPVNDAVTLGQTVASGILDNLGLTITQTDRDEVNLTLAETPSLPSLGAVAETSLQLPTVNLTNLSAAMQLDNGSSWVTTEYARALAIANTPDEAEALGLEATQQGPTDIEAWVNYGIILRSNGKGAEARAAFEQALSLNPNHAVALVGLASVLDNSAEAQTRLEAALEAYPRLSQAYLELANLQFQDNPQTALQTLRRGTQIIPETVALHSAFMDYALQLGDAQGALSYLQGELSKQTSPSAGLYGLAAKLMSAYPSEAAAIIQQGRGRYPDNANLTLLDARMLESQGEYAAAESLLQTAVSSNSSPELINRLAIVQAKQGKLEAAKETFASLGGDNATSQYNLGQLYLEAGENEAALSVFEPLIASNPNDADALAYYGVALARLGRYQQALEAFDKSLSLNSNQTIALQGKTQLEQQVQISGGQAIQMNQEATQLFSQGQNALSNRDFATAASLFAQARTLDDNGLLAFYEGYAYYFDGKPRQAVPGFNRALEAFPNSDIVLNNLGLVQIELGRLDLALDYLTKATSQNSANDQAHLNLGLVYYRLSDYDKAISEWETALNLNPSLDATVSDLLADARAKAQ
ncbi:MAG: tetratricopeptide repeat protein [Trueperaceae bacterium]|nr:tetratricopeptide repeat protein [Trueperaceae bacterium]